ncbi:hypothetical protein HY643_01030 [Candidatus Woesearchaeota archaeon]|nr:hypothetical protein [Candidatus Woesearchaeota archaeon]
MNKKEIKRLFSSYNKKDVVKKGFAFAVNDSLKDIIEDYCFFLDKVAHESNIFEIFEVAKGHVELVRYNKLDVNQLCCEVNELVSRTGSFVEFSLYLSALIQKIAKPNEVFFLDLSNLSPLERIGFSLKKVKLDIRGDFGYWLGMNAKDCEFLVHGDLVIRPDVSLEGAGIGVNAVDCKIVICGYCPREALSSYCSGTKISIINK